jgi:hypothetical protein
VDRWFFLYGFEKNDRETIDARELAALQAIAAALMGLDPKLLAKAVIEGELEEIGLPWRSEAGARTLCGYRGFSKY